MTFLWMIFRKKQFTDFYEFLVEKNKVMNLTGITDFQEVLVKHFLDSLSCVKALDMKKVKSMIDVGTGAGFTRRSSEDCVSRIWRPVFWIP